MFKKYILPILFLLFFSGTLKAQTLESFIPDVSYPYLQKLIDTAKKYYPQVKIRAKRIDIARSNHREAQVSWFDIITPSYIYNPQNSLNVVTPTVFNGYQIAFTVNLGSLFAKPFQIRAARQAVDVAVFEQQEYARTLETQVKQRYFTYLETQADLRLRTRAELDASASVKQAKLRFEKGELSLKDYNDAMVVQYTQSSYRIQGELAVFNSKVALEELVGKRLEDVK